MKKRRTRHQRFQNVLETGRIRVPVEMLERRLLLAAQPVVLSGGVLTITGDISGSPTADTITLRDEAGNPAHAEVVFDGTVYDSDSNGNDLAWANISSVSISGGAGNDTVNLEDTVSTAPVTVTLGSGTDNLFLSPVANDLTNIQGAVTVAGTATSSITVDNQNNSTALTVTSTTITGTGIGKITYGTAKQLTLNTGGNVLITSNAIATFVNSANDTTISVGNPTNTAQNLKGALTIESLSGLVNLTVDDSADTTTRSVTLGLNTLTAIAGSTITFDPTTLGDLTLIAGGPVPNGDTAGNTFTIQALPSQSLLTIDGGPDDDTFALGSISTQLDTIAGQLNLDGQGGFNTVTLNDTNDFTGQTYSVSGTNVSVLGGMSMDYANMQKLTLNGGAGGNVVDVTGTAANSLTTISAGAGNVGSAINSVFIGSSTTEGDLSGILGSLTVSGGNALSTIEIDNQDSADALTMTSSTIADTSNPNVGLISYATARLLTINTGGDVNVQLASSTVITQINAAAGSTITLGNSINGTQEIKGIVNVDSLGSSGLVNLTIDDSEDPTPRTVVVADDTVTGFVSGIGFGFDPLALGNLTLLGGGPAPGAADTSGNIFNIQEIPASASVTLEAGPGDDTISVGSAANELNTIAGSLNIDGQGGFNTLTINDQNTVASQSYTVTNSAVERVDGPSIGYANMSRLTVNAGAGSNDVYVQSTLADALTTINAGTGNAGSGVNAVYIGSGGLNSDLGGIAGDLTISAGNALSTIEVDDQEDSGALALTNATLAGTSFDGLITYATARLLTLDVGGDVNVQSTSATVITDINEFATGTIDVGNPINGAQDVKGLINLGGSGEINLIIDDSADPLNRTATITGSAITGIAGSTISFNPTSLASLTLIGGGAGASGTSGNTFNIQGVPDSAAVTINGGPGDDTINIGSAANTLDSIAGTITVDGQDGFNTLTINDQNTVTSQAYTVSDDEISRVGGPDIYYSDLSRVALNAGAGSNTVNIESTLSDALTTVNAGTGSTGSGVNAVYIGSEASPSDLDGIAGDLTISGGNALSTIEIDDQGDTDGLTLTNATLAGSAFDGLITYSTARILTINTGGNVAVQSTSAAVITDIGSAGGTTVSIGNTINGAQDVKGLLNLNSLSGLINVTVDNSADPTARTVTYNGTALSGLAGAAIGIIPAALGTLTLIGGPANANGLSGNTYNIQGVPSGSTLILNAGEGDDVINVGSIATDLDPIAGSLIVNGEGGFNTLTVNDTNNVASETYTVTNTDITRSQTPVDVTYSSMNRITLNGGAGGNTIHIRSTAPGALTTVNGGTGVNAINVGSADSPPASSDISGVVGDLTIGGGDALSTIEIDDQSGTTPLTLTNNTITGAGLGIITYATGRTLTIDSGANLAVQSTIAAFIYPINLASGKTATVNNSLTGAQDDKGQIILGALSGRINLTVDNSEDLLSRTVTFSDTALTGLAGAAITYQPTTLGNVSLIGGPLANVNTNGNTFGIQAIASGTTVTVKTGPGDDTVNVGSATNDMGTILGTLTITGQNGLNSLNFNDQGATASETYTLATGTFTRSGVPTISFSGATRITLNGSGGGTSGGNTVNITGVAAGSTATINAGAEVNTINIGSGGAPPSSSNISAIAGDLVINGQNALSVLNVNDQSGHAAITLNNNTIARTGSGLITYGTLRILTLNAGANVAVQSTSILTYVNSVAGATITFGNTINGAQDIKGAVDIGTISSMLNVVVDNSADLVNRTAILTDTSLSGLAGAAIGFPAGALQSLTLIGGSSAAPANAGNTFNIQGTPSGVAVVINAGPGDDVINVGSVGNALDSIQDASLTINGQGGLNTLNVNDQGWTLPRSYGVTGGTVTWDSNGLAYNNIGKLNLNGGGGGNAIAVASTLTGSVVTISAGTGINAITTAGLSGLPGSLIINGGNALSTITVNNAPSTATLSVAASTISSGAFTITYSTALDLYVYSGGNIQVLGTSLTTILNTAAGSTVYLGNTLDGAQDIKGTVDIGNTGGPVNLVIDDSYDVASQQPIVTATSVTKLAGATVGFVPSSLISLTLDGGGSGGNTFNVQATPVGVLTTINTGASDDVINVGSPTNSINNIAGPLFINGQNGGNTLTINDQGNLPLAAGARMYLVNGAAPPAAGTAPPTIGTLTRTGDPAATPAMITFTSMRTFTLNTSSSITLNGSPTGTNTILNAGSTDDIIAINANGGPVAINAGGGNDMITVGSPTTGLSLVTGALTIDGQAGTNTLTFDDSMNPAGMQTYTVTAGSVIAAATMTYTNAQTVNLMTSNMGTSTVNVTGTADKVATNITGNGSTNTFNVSATTGNLVINSSGTGNTFNISGNTGTLAINSSGTAAATDTVNIGTPGSTVANIKGAITLTDGNPGIALTVDDSGDLANVTPTINAGAITNLAPVAINYGGGVLASLAVKLGGGNNNVTVAGTPTKITTTLTAGDGNNTININAVGGPLTATTGAGDDTFNVGGAGGGIPLLASNITVNGDNQGSNAQEFDTLNFNDSTDAVGNQTYSLTGTNLTVGNRVITYSNINALNLTTASNGNSTITVVDTAPAAANNMPGMNSNTLTSEGNSNTFNVRNTSSNVFIVGSGTFGSPDSVNIGTPAGMLPMMINYPVDVSAAANAFVNLTIDDSKDAANQSPTIDASSLTGMTSANIMYAASNLASLIIKFGTGANSILVSDTPSNAQGVQTQITTAGNGINTIGIDAATGPLSVTTGGGNDTFNVGSMDSGLLNIATNITLDGGAGNDTVNFTDSSGCSGIYTLSPVSLVDGGITMAYANFETVNLTGNVNGGNTFNITGTAKGAATTTTAQGIGNTFNVSSTTGPLTVVPAGAPGSPDVVNIGVDGPATVAAITGEVTISDPTGSAAVIVDDSGDAVDQNPVINANALTGLAPVAINFIPAQLASLTVLLGSGDDTLVINNAAMPITANGGDGVDSFTIGSAAAGLANITAPLTLDGGAGANTLTFNDLNNAAAQKYTLNEMSLTAGAVMSYANFTAINLTTSSGGASTIDVANTAAATTTTINASDEGNTFTVAATTGILDINAAGTAAAPDSINIGGPARDVTFITNDIVISDPAPQVDLTIDNSSQGAGQMVSVGAGATSGISPAPIIYTPGSLNSLSVSLGSGDNNLTVTDTPAGAATTINTGNGANTIVVQATTGSLTINEGTGNNKMTIGSAGEINGITGVVLVFGGGGMNSITFDDSNAVGDNGYWLDNAGGLDQFSYQRGAALGPIVGATLMSGKPIFAVAPVGPAPIVYFAGIADVTLNLSMGSNGYVESAAFAASIAGLGGSFLADPNSVDSTLDIEDETLLASELQLLDIDSVYIGNGGTLDIDTAANFTISQLVLDSGGTISGSGNLLITDAASFLGGTVSSSGDIVVDNGAELAIAGDVSASSGTIHNLADGTVIGEGTFSGTLINDGQVYPGGDHSPGTLSLGTYVQTQTGELNEDIEGKSSFDQILVTQGAQLAGELDIALGYTPALTDTFPVVSGAGVSGRFATLVGTTIADTNLDGIPDIYFVAKYDPTDATLIVYQTPTISSSTPITNPDRPTIDLADEDDTGSSDIDNVTQLTSLTFYVTADAGTDVTIDDGNTQIDGPIVMPASDFITVVISWPVAGIAAEGPHPLTVISTNSEGGSSQSEQLLVTIDTIAPAAPSTPALLADSDSNIVGDNITNINPPTFEGTAEANSTVRLYNGLGELIGQGTAGSDTSDGDPNNGLGIWQITVSPLAEGVDPIYATAEDLAGNISPGSVSSYVTIDTTPPQRPTITLDPDDDSGTSDSDDITRYDALDFLVTADPGTSVIIKDGNTIIDGPFTMPGGGSTSVELSLPGDGTYPLSTESTDTAGNTTQSEQLLVTVDTTPPAPPSTPVMLASSDSGYSNSDGVTNVTAPAFVGTSEPNALITLYANDAIVGTATASSLGTWEITSEPLSDGVYQMSASAQDVAGNLSALSSDAAIEIDTTAPPTPYLDLSAESDSGNAYDNVTYISPQDFTATVNEAGTATPDHAVFWAVYDRDGTDPETLLESGGPTAGGVFDFTTNLPIGTNDLRLQVQDIAGNLSQDYLLDVTVISISGQSSPGVATVLTPAAASSTTPTIAQGIITAANGKNYFQFTPTSSGKVNLDVTAPGSKLVSKLTVMDNKMHTLATNSNFKKSASSHVTMNVLANQTYYLQVASTHKTTGFYELAVAYAGTSSEDSNGHTTKTATALSLASGSAAASGDIAVPGSADVFRITPADASSLSVNVTPTDGSLDPVLQIYDAKGHLVDATSTDDAQWIFSAMAGQTYFIYVSGRGGRTGGYNLSVSSVS